MALKKEKAMILRRFVILSLLMGMSSQQVLAEKQFQVLDMRIESAVREYRLQAIQRKQVRLATYAAMTAGVLGIVAYQRYHIPALAERVGVLEARTADIKLIAPTRVTPESTTLLYSLLVSMKDVVQTGLTKASGYLGSYLAYATLGSVVRSCAGMILSPLRKMLTHDSVVPVNDCWLVAEQHVGPRRPPFAIISKEAQALVNMVIVYERAVTQMRDIYHDTTPVADYKSVAVTAMMHDIVSSVERMLAHLECMRSADNMTLEEAMALVTISRHLHEHLVPQVNLLGNYIEQMVHAQSDGRSYDELRKEVLNVSGDLIERERLALRPLLHHSLYMVNSWPLDVAALEIVKNAILS